MSKLSIIVIGAGTMGRRHIEYLCASDACQLAAVCDSNSGAAALAAKHGVPFFHDPIEALDLVSPDGAIIAAPTQLHEELALACIRPRDRNFSRKAGHSYARRRAQAC